MRSLGRKFRFIFLFVYSRGEFVLVYYVILVMFLKSRIMIVYVYGVLGIFIFILYSFNKSFMIGIFFIFV